MTDSLQQKLEVKNISASAKNGKSLIKGAGFTLKQGELVGLIGPNGAGKTSLLRAACGLIPAGSGDVNVNGQSLTDLNA